MASSSSSSKEVFVKTENLSEKSKTEELREKLHAQKEKRKLAEKYAHVKGLADESDGDEDAADWYKKVKSSSSRKRTSGSDLRKDSSKKRRSEYSSKELEGLAIGHKTDAFEEGHQVILTLKDKGVLDEAEDVLQNVNLVDNEKTEKNNENRKKRTDYKPWDDDEFETFDRKKNLLSKYDEEIDGAEQNVFRIGDKLQREKTLKDFHDDAFKSGQMFSTLSEFKVASEYYTADEMVKFKKTKRKGALRKRKGRQNQSFEIDSETADAQTASTSSRPADHGTRSRRRGEETSNESQQKVKLDISQFENDEDEDEEDFFGPEEDLTGVRIEEDQAEKELQAALNRTRKLKLKESVTVEENIARIAENVKKIKTEQADNGFGTEFQATNEFVAEFGDDDDENLNSAAFKLVLNKTSEFCRNLGTVGGPGGSGAGPYEMDDFPEDVKMEIDSDLSKSDDEDDVRRKDGRDSDYDSDYKDNVKDKVVRNQPILEDEPLLTGGVAGALQLAMRKGYLDKEGQKQAGTSKNSATISAQDYAIEEKFNDNDFASRRDRYSGGVTAFKEKDDYRPDFKLDYVDEKGHQMNAKEAFRYLSHKFHGKTSGKNKIDKRLRKLEQESKIRQMASTDTPLNTLKLLQDKQKSLKTPFLVLTGKDSEAKKALEVPSGSSKKRK